MTRTSVRTIAGLAAAAVACSIGAFASPAAAHVEGQSVQAGERSTVPFVVQHGCDGLATTKVEIKIPAGAGDPQPEELEGWEGSVEGDVVTYDNGELPDDVELAFPVTFTAPSTAQTLRFPVIQWCGDVELAWIGEDHDSEHPAPIVEVVGTAAPTTSTEAEATTTTGEGAAAETTTTEAEATTTTSEVETTDAVEEDEDDDSSALPIVIGVVAVLALVGGGVAYAKSRKGSDPDEV